MTILPGDVLCKIAAECDTIYFAITRVCKAFQIINRPEYSRVIQAKLGHEVHMQSGYIEFTVRGELHRDGGPAVIKLSLNPALRKQQIKRITRQNIFTYGDKQRRGNGIRQWYSRGLRHREDGPAMIYRNGYCEWYRHDAMYLGEGTLVQCNGYVEWRRGKDIHRAGAPARIYENGDEEWYTNNNLHRRNGPARTTKIDGITYYINGLMHRDGKPARIYPDGTMEWRIRDKLHRRNGPAIVFPDGVEKWYLHNMLHRDDGPAVTHPDGYSEWWKNDELIFKHTGAWPRIDDPHADTKQCTNQEQNTFAQIYAFYATRKYNSNWYSDDEDSCDDLEPMYDNDDDDDKYYGVLDYD